MSVFSAVFGCRGDGGFNGPLLGVCRGVVGFNVAMLSRLVRDILRADRPDVGASAKKFALRHCGHRVGAKKFAQHTKNGPKWGFYGALGEFFRGPAVVGSRRASLLRRVPGSRALLLTVLTLQCAAKPYWWHGGQPAQATTYRVNVRIKGAAQTQVRAAPSQAVSSVLALVLLQALIGAANLGLGLFATHPVGALDALAGLEVLVDLEEVLDFQAVEL